MYRKHILVIDDSPTQCVAIASWLAPTCHVDTCLSLAEMIELPVGVEYDIVFVDVVMPAEELTGTPAQVLQFAKKIRGASILTISETSEHADFPIERDALIKASRDNPPNPSKTLRKIASDLRKYGHDRE